MDKVPNIVKNTRAKCDLLAASKKKKKKEEEEKMEIISNSSGINREVAKAKEDLCRAIRRGIRKQLENDQVEVTCQTTCVESGISTKEKTRRRP